MSYSYIPNHRLVYTNNQNEFADTDTDSYMAEEDTFKSNNIYINCRTPLDDVCVFVQ